MTQRRHRSIVFFFFTGLERDGDEERERPRKTHFMDCRIQTLGTEYST